MKALAVTVMLVVVLTFGIGLQNWPLGYDAGPGTTVTNQPLWLVQVRL